MKKEFYRMLLYLFLAMSFLTLAIAGKEYDVEFLKNEKKLRLFMEDRLPLPQDQVYTFRKVSGGEEILQSLPKGMKKKIEDQKKNDFTPHIVRKNIFEHWVFLCQKGNHRYHVGYFSTPSVFKISIGYLPFFLISYIGVGLLTFFYLDNRREAIRKQLKDILIWFEDKDKKNPINIEEDTFDEFIGDLSTTKSNYFKELDVFSRKMKFMDEVYESLKEGLLILDENKNITSFNKASIRFLSGSPFFHYKGKPYTTLISNKELDHIIEEGYQDGNTKIIRVEESDFYLQIEIYPQMEQEIITGLVLLIQDIREEIKLEKMRKEFTSNVIHELKTPLTTIQGYSQLLQEGMVPEKDVQKVYQNMVQASQSLFYKIDSLMALHRIEESTKGKDFNVLDLNILLQEVMEEQRGLLEKRGIQWELKGVLDGKFFGNPKVLKEIFKNIVINAVYYNKPNGKITISIFIRDGIHIVFKDTGIGMPAHILPRIFERFFMVDESRSLNKNSTGIGLSIVKHGVLYHGGKIDVQSKPGEGTSFDIIFPMDLYRIT